MPTNESRTPERAELQALEDRLCRLVASVHGIVTASEIERLDYLRKSVGQRWDAVNRQWLPL